jgi:rsbT co-antagonist protein RsbR
MALNLKKKKKQLLDSWIQLQMEDQGLREDLLSNEELRTQSDELITSLLDILDDPKNTDVNSNIFDPVVEIISTITITRARQGFSPRETGLYIFSMKDAFLRLLQSELNEDAENLYKESLRVSKIIDSLGVVAFETYLKGREEVILRQTVEIGDLSTPVIRVWEGILAMPIIGTLDSARTQVVMENLLQEIVNTGSGIAILDISGVPAVDSLVAQHLIKTVSATRLMGAECIISGIRPEIAQTIVHLGIDLTGIITKSTLENALRFAFSVLRIEVKKIK